MLKSQRISTSGCEDELLEGVESEELPPGEPDEEEPLQVGGELVDKDVLLVHLRAVFPQLMERDRVVLSSYYGGLESTSRTAAECGIGAALVKVRLFRARRRLERALRLRSSEQRARRLAGRR